MTPNIEKEETFVECDECNGSGETECDLCEGFGQWTECAHGGNCPCDGYTVECEECQTRGIIFCKTCQGQGEYPET
jgi:hypothetical protein